MSKPRSLTEILAAKGGRSSHSHDQTESSTLAANTNGFASKSGREIEETEDEMQELEIPSSSTVLHDDSDLLQLLSGATINQNFEKDLSKVKIDVPDGSTQYDIIELYSTIAFLKKENQELRKEIEFSKKSKEAILKETNARYESQLEKMRTENQKYCEDFPLLENELNELRQINEALLQEKEELMEALNKLREKSSQSQEAISVRSELQAVKMENNRLKMEIARLKSDSDSFLQNDLPSFQRQLLAKDQEINDIQQQFSMEIDQLRAESSKEQDQIRQLRNEISDKTQQIAKVTTDFMKLDRQFISMQNENNMLKERLQSSHSSDRELQEAKFRINSLEAEVYELRKLNHQLQMRATDYGTTLPPHEFRQFPSSTAVHSHPIAYETPPPPPNRSSINTAYSDSSYTPYNQPTLYQNSGNSLSRNQNAPKSLSAMGITANRMAVETSAAPSSSSSLLSVLQSKKDSPGSHDFNYPPAGTNRRNVSSTGGTPFATDLTSVSLMQGFDQLERDLTNLMTEKATLQEESERLHQRGLKTLKDRTRLQQVEHRLNELSKDISHLRMRLSSKPA